MGDDLLAKKLLIAACIVLSACSSPAQQISLPTATVTSSIPSVLPATSTPTLAPAAPTPTPSPTAYITPPIASEFANLPILMYHHLSELPNNASELQLTWTVTPKNFETQMEWLAQHGYHTISMSQLGAFLKHKQDLPINSIVITFDDGWAEQYSVAFGVLKKNNLSATFYVYTRFLDKSLYLTWKQVEEMAGAGMEFGAHTLTHPHLRSLSPSAAAKEIAESKTELEKKLGKPVTTFAYPFGEYNGSVIDLVKRAGFESAVTINPGFRQRADEILLLRRLRISYRDSLQDFINQLPQ